MTVAAICPGCRKKYLLGEKLVGKRLKCKCGERFVLESGDSHRNDEHVDSFPKHPERQQLALFAEGGLDHAAHETIERHVTDCQECCDLLREISVGNWEERLVEAPPVKNFADEMTTLARGMSDTKDEPTQDFSLRAESPANATKSNRRFGDYELMSEISRGGMGVVYKARHTKLNRIVAIKMILAGALADREDIERFQVEAESAATLDHANIVPIFEVGMHDGQHYFSMGFVEGGSLADRVKNGPLPALEEAVHIIRLVTQAVDYAHRKGIIHRDLKPSNILLDIDDQPKVTDFGLAKRVDADHELTASGKVMGTPSYMPPEQAAGQNENVNEKSDVYALGATLYYLLTGRPPFQTDNPLETLFQVMNQDPVPPRTLNPTVPIDINTICMKCLAKDQRKRYESAAALADDLSRFANGKPIQARPVGWFERMAKWTHREPAMAAIMSMVPVLLIGDKSTAFSLAGVILGVHLPCKFRIMRLAIIFTIVAVAVTIPTAVLSEFFELGKRISSQDVVKLGIYCGITVTGLFFIFDSLSILEDTARRRWKAVFWWLLGAGIFSLVLLASYIFLRWKSDSLGEGFRSLLDDEASVETRMMQTMMWAAGFHVFLIVPNQASNFLSSLALGMITGKLLGMFDRVRIGDINLRRMSAIMAVSLVHLVPSSMMLIALTIRSNVLRGLVGRLNTFQWVLIPVSAIVAAFLSNCWTDGIRRRNRE